MVASAIPGSLGHAKSVGGDRGDFGGKSHENMGTPTKIPWFIVVCHWYLNVFDQYMAMERGFVLLNHATPLRIPVQRNP